MEFGLKKKSPKVSETVHKNEQNIEKMTNSANPITSPPSVADIDDLSLQERPIKSFGFALSTEIQDAESVEPAPEPEWVEFFTEDTPKKAYYHNEITGETVWEKPEGVLIEWDHENAPLPEDWKECFTEDEAKTVYYYNTVSGESVWEKPHRIFSNRKSIRKIRPKSTITGANGAVLHMGITKALKTELYARRATAVETGESSTDKSTDSPVTSSTATTGTAEPVKKSFMPSSLLKQISRRGSSGVEETVLSKESATGTAESAASTTTSETAASPTGTGAGAAVVTPTKTSSSSFGLLKQLVTPRKTSQATTTATAAPSEVLTPTTPTPAVESVVSDGETSSAEPTPEQSITPFVPHEKPSAPLMGWLEKKSHGGFSSAWEKRYLRVLEETGSLIYSKTDNMAGGPSSWIDLKTVSEVTIYELNGKPDPTRFTLEAPDHVYKFRATSEGEAKLWVDGLNAWRLYLSEKGGVVPSVIATKDMSISQEE